MQVKARIDNVGEIYGEEEEVKEGIESGVVLQVLRFVLTHA
jgi:ABC-type enterochelin transport system substrate-binding protein